MTLEQYIQNPVGKGASTLSAIMRESINRMYTEKFNNILLRENGKIDHYKYKTKDNEFFIHVKVPSEVVKNFYYDVVFKFFTDETVVDLGRSLNKYNFQAFSNDPAFNYTHAFVFIQNDLLVPELKTKVLKQSITTHPKIKNPNEQIAYCKSLYFAYLFIYQRGLFKKIVWTDAEDYDQQKVLSRIMDSATKIALREEEDKKLDKKKKIILDKGTADRLMRKGISQESKDRIAVQTSHQIKTVKHTRAVNSTRMISGKRSNKK